MGVVELFPLPPDDELVVEGVLFGEVLVILYFLFIAPDDPPPPRRGPRDSSSDVKLEVSTVSWSKDFKSVFQIPSIHLRVGICLMPTILVAKQGQRMQQPS